MKLKTKYKRIYFKNISAKYPKRVTKTYLCYNYIKDPARLFGQLLGVVKWYPQLNQYCFFIGAARIRTLLILSSMSSADISHFCNQLKEQRKQERKASDERKKR